MTIAICIAVYLVGFFATGLSNRRWGYLDNDGAGVMACCAMWPIMWPLVILVWVITNIGTLFTVPYDYLSDLFAGPAKSSYGRGTR